MTTQQTKAVCSPIQEWMNLQMQFIEDLNFLKVEDFSKSPDKFIALQLKISAENIVKMQEYLRKSWSLYERVITQSNPFLSADFLSQTPENPLFNLSESLMGRISNSIFTPTYLALNPFEMAKVFASDMASDLTGKYPKANHKSKN